MIRIYELFRSLFFCLRFLPFKQAVKIPIYLSNNVRNVSIKGRIVLDYGDLKRYQIAIGHSGSQGLQAFHSSILIQKGGRLVFKGPAVIGQGTVIRVDANATMEIGKKFYCNKNCYFRCHKSIVIGERVTLGWNNTLNDADGHSVYYGDKSSNSVIGTITVGNHVWITTNCFINKDVIIPDECVVALGSVVNKFVVQPHSLIGGVPAKVIRENINWKE